MSAWTAEERSLLWLDSFPLEPVFKQALLKRAGGARALVAHFDGLASEFSNAETYAQMKCTLADAAYFERLRARLEREKITPIFYGGADYPDGWKAFPDAPLCLYAKGDLRLLREKKFAVVGSRRTIESARKLGESVAKELASRFAVTTGTADGGDEAAVRGGLAGGKCICLVAGGLDALPKENLLLGEVEKQGLLLSARPFGAQIRVFSYEYRNKLLAALCEGVLVIGAAAKSGALITAKYAKEQGKNVFAFPYAPSVAAGAGCNALIKAGGYLTETAGDIFEKYGIEVSEKPKISLTETEEKIVEILRQNGEMHVSQISQRTGIPVFKLTTLLAALEVKGAAVKLGGNRYCAV